MSKLAILTVILSLLSLAALTPASAQSCAKQARIEACVSCIKKRGVSGPRGGWDWCSKNFQQTSTEKTKKKK